MQTIRRKVSDFKDLKFVIDLTDYGKSISDIDDIIFIVKDSEDGTNVFEKRMSNGEINISGTQVLDVLVKWDSNEYLNFNIGKHYLAGVFVKFQGDPEFDENTNDIFTLIIEDDFV